MASKLGTTKKIGIFACTSTSGVADGFAQERDSSIYSLGFEEAMDCGVCVLHETASSAYGPFGLQSYEFVHQWSKSQQQR